MPADKGDAPRTKQVSLQLSTGLASSDTVPCSEIRHLRKRNQIGDKIEVFHVHP